MANSLQRVKCYLLFSTPEFSSYGFSGKNSKTFKQYYTFLLTALLHSELNTWLPVTGTWNEFKMRSSDKHILAWPKLGDESINQ